MNLKSICIAVFVIILLRKTQITIRVFAVLEGFNYLPSNFHFLEMRLTKKLKVQPTGAGRAAAEFFALQNLGIRKNGRFARGKVNALLGVLFLLCSLTASAEVIGGATYADSANFDLNTTGLSPIVGGATYSETGDFVLNTTGQSAVIGGATYTDSSDFVLNTTGLSTIIGSSTYADSSDFVLNTTGLSVIIGGAAFADSADFILNTLNSIDIGLRAYDGTSTVKIGAEPGALTSPFRIRKNGINYGLILVETNDPSASKFRLQTAAGIKALLKLP